MYWARIVNRMLLCRVTYSVLVAASSLSQLKALCGPGDDGEPVVTVMLPDED